MVLLAGCGAKVQTEESSTAAPVQETFGIIPDNAPELAPQAEASEAEPDSSVDTEEPQSTIESAAEPEITPLQQPEETSTPEFQWQTAAPEDYGLPSDVIDDLHSRYPSLPVLSAVIYRDGYLLDEYYADGYDENSTFILNSASKSVTSALIGIAIDQGLIESVDTPIVNYFPQLQSSAEPPETPITESAEDPETMDTAELQEETEEGMLPRAVIRRAILDYGLDSDSNSAQALESINTTYTDALTEEQKSGVLVYLRKVL